MNSDLFTLTDKNIIITGASSGIGRICAVSCSQQYGKVILLSRNQVRLEETLSMMKDKEKHGIYSIDITDYDKIEGIIAEIVSRYGKINGIINCAGISTTIPLNAVSPQKMEHFFQTNVIGAINLTKHVVKSSNFSEMGGSVIFISSVMGVAGENGKVLYSMTKGAIISAVKSLAIEFASRKIRVNCISPGVVNSPMSENAIYSRNQEALNRIKSLHPLGLGQPEDVANACVFLLSDAARWITGTNLIVDGGYLAK
jgi:NAD(P)-dependent dehydrogenase (short-subunit alcohol dehydrogenase family)